MEMEMKNYNKLCNIIDNSKLYENLNLPTSLNQNTKALGLILYSPDLKNWRENIVKIIDGLFIQKDYDTIIFLYNNIQESKKHIINCICHYEHKYLIETLKLTDYQTIANNAAQIGDLDLVKYCIEKGADNYNIIGIKAAKHGHLHIIKYLAEFGLTCYMTMAEFAAENGHFDIVKYIVELGLECSETIAEFAALGGHLDILKYIIKLGFVKDYRIIITNAINRNHLDIVKYIVELGYKDYKKIAIDAIYAYNLDILKYAFELGATNYKEIKDIAKSLGNWKIENYVEDIITKSLDGYNIFSLIIAFYKNENLEQYIDKIKPEDYDLVASVFAALGILDLVKIMVNKGAKDYEKIASFAQLNEDKTCSDILKYLSELSISR